MKIESDRAEQITSAVLRAGRAFLAIVFVTLGVVVLLPDVRSSVRGLLLTDYRLVLSTAHGDLSGSGEHFTVAKIRTRHSIFVEVYQAEDEGRQRLVQRITLPFKKDGYFNFNGQATNLAIDDIDRDGQKEILVPAFDENMVGHLSIYRYDSMMGSFQRSIL